MLRPIVVLMISLVFVAHAASAENWPGTRPLRFEAGSAAGGIIDLVPRMLSDHLSSAIGVPVVVENRPGAGGNIAASFVAKATPDGHTLLVTGSNQVVNQTLLPEPGFDYERDLAPVSMVLSVKLVLVAAPSFPAESIADVIRIAKQKPRSVSIAIGPVGTPNHLGAEMLAQYGGIDLMFVPYDGIAVALPDLLAGRVNLAVGSISTFLPEVRSGALKALAVLSTERSTFAPEIPTAAEAGLPQMQFDGWICIMTTGGTPAPIIARLDAAIAKVLMQPKVREAFAHQGIEDFYMNTPQLATFLHSESARFGGLLKHSKMLKPPQ